MSRFPSMPLFAGDMLADTEHLTNEEFGVYHRLLYAMWRRNGWIPDDDAEIARICRMGMRRWQRHLKPKMMPFLICEEGELSQKKLLKVRENIARISARQRENAIKRWHLDSKENNNIADATGYATSMHRARDSKTKTKKESFNCSALLPSLGLEGRSVAAPAPEETLTAEEIARIQKRLSFNTH